MDKLICRSGTAVFLAAEGFNSKKDLLSQLLTLNQQVADRIEKGEPVPFVGVGDDVRSLKSKSHPI